MIGLKRGTVRLVVHQDEWINEAENTIKELKSLLGDTAIDIQHIGSTAIPLVPAKPIIDIVMIELLKSGLVDNSLLCELATHQDFPRLMADLEIYVNGVAGKQVQSANTIVDAVSATIMKQHNPGLSDLQLRRLITAHIDDDSFSRRWGHRSPYPPADSSHRGE